MKFICFNRYKKFSVYKLDKKLKELNDPDLVESLYSKNINQKKSSITSDEIKMVMEALGLYVKGANQYDVDFSKYNRDKCKPEEFCKDILQGKDEAVEIFSVLTDVDYQVAKNYIDENNYKFLCIEKLKSDAKKVEEELDSIPDGMGYSSYRIDELSDEFNKAYQQYLRAEQNRKDEMLTINELRQKCAVKKDEDWSR